MSGKVSKMWVVSNADTAHVHMRMHTYAVHTFSTRQYYQTGGRFYIRANVKSAAAKPLYLSNQKVFLSAVFCDLVMRCLAIFLVFVLDFSFERWFRKSVVHNYQTADFFP